MNLTYCSQIVVNKVGIETFGKALEKVVEEETVYNGGGYKRNLTKNKNSLNSKIALEVDHLVLTMSKFGMEDEAFDLDVVLDHFGGRSGSGTTVASFVRMMRLWNESAAEKLHKTLLGREKEIKTHIHGLKHTPFDN